MLRKMMVVAALVGFVAAGSAAGRIHTVRRGETLEGIGRRYGVDARTLAGANGLRDPNLVMAGRALSIPAPRPSPAAKAPAAAVAPAARPAPATRTTPAPGSLRETVVRMPPAQLASSGRGSRIIVPRDRTVLRNAFLRFSRMAGVPSDLAMALAWQESGWQRHRVSSTRAVGVMQLMPDTVEFVSVQLLGTKPLDPRDPLANIRMGTRFLRYLLDSNGGNVDRALASYYQGLRSVRERGMLPETEQFVANVKALRGRL
jgi:soluble lytic murein transglycosylase-like protein